MLPNPMIHMLGSLTTTYALVYLSNLSEDPGGTYCFLLQFMSFIQSFVVVLLRFWSPKRKQRTRC